VNSYGGGALPRPLFFIMKKHIICHIHCLDHPSVLKIVKNLVKYNHIFDGEKIATITHVAKEFYVFSLVSNILTSLGFDIIEVENDQKYRETSRFFDIALPKLLAKTQEGTVFYCHSKGVIYHPESEDGKVTNLWTDVLWHYTLERFDSIPIDSEQFSTFGSCMVRSPNFLPDKIGENYCYVGTFFWIKLNKLVGKQFTPHSKFYLEGLPGLVSDSTEAFNLGPELTTTESPYNISTWNKKGIYYGFPN
jgi:hypothetical protein